MKSLDGKGVAIVLSFILGGVFTYFVTDYIHLKNKSMSIRKVESRKKKVSSIDPFTQIEKQMNRMFNSSPFLGFHSFDNSFQSDFNIYEREDGEFAYVEIEGEGIDKESLKIDINQGMISISGQIKKSSEDSSSNGFASSSFTSSFSKTFNVPADVEEGRAKIEAKKDRIIIKFPKIKV